jgi:predicted lysophospholipase L1 biosynthesis ABC-type transport system permease subunit
MGQPPKKRPEKRMDDWMRLILLNWAMISVVMFYSIIVGLIVGTLLVFAARSLLGSLGLDAGLFRVFPFSPAATAMVAATIALVFLASFRSLRFDCRTDGYRLAVTRPTVRALVRGAGIGLGIPIASALLARWFLGG